MHTVAGSRWWLKYLNSCTLEGGLIQFQAPGCCRPLESEPEDGRLLSSKKNFTDVYMGGYVGCMLMRWHFIYGSWISIDPVDVGVHRGQVSWVQFMGMPSDNGTSSSESQERCQGADDLFKWPCRGTTVLTEWWMGQENVDWKPPGFLLWSHQYLSVLDPLPTRPIFLCLVMWHRWS